MNVAEIGEFGLISAIRKMVARSGAGRSETGLVLGIGDDAAVLRRPRGLLLATTDAMVEGIHFNVSSTRWRELGWKSLAVNLSDIAAMGGIPAHALVSLSLTPGLEVRWVLEFFRGFMSLADREGVVLAGGNLTRAPQISINITILGETGPGNRYLARGAARPGDLVAVTGWPGLSAAALLTLHDKDNRRGRTNSIFQRAHFRPEPRLVEGRQLLSLGVKAAVDLSDGLLADLGHICEESRVSAVVYESGLPIHPRLKAVYPEKALDLVLGGGEDYELLFTGPAEKMRIAKRLLKVPVTVIGEVIKRDRKLVRVQGADGRDCGALEGWDHFRERPSKVRD